MSLVRHPVCARLRALASVGAVADADDIAELKLGPTAAKLFTEASERCALVYAEGSHARATNLAEEIGFALVAKLPPAQRSENYLRNENASLIGKSPAELADIVHGRRSV